jgi:hypothetical protein
MNYLLITENKIEIKENDLWRQRDVMLTSAGHELSMSSG